MSVKKSTLMDIKEDQETGQVIFYLSYMRAFINRTT